MTCARGRATTLPVTPTVWLVVDGSGSMREDFDRSSRWEALRTALMDSNGVVARLEKAVRFGLVIYNGPELGGGGGGRDRPGNGGGSDCNGFENIDPLCGCFFGLEDACCEPACGAPAPTPPMTPPMPVAPEQCANVMVVNPELSNYAAINMAYPDEQLGGSTPTHHALKHIVSSLPVTNSSLPDANAGPVYVILATDGQPNDTCDGTTGGSFEREAADQVVAAVTTGVQMGMRMFVISLAGDDDELRTHLQEVANIGSPGQAPFEPAGRDELVTAIQAIIGGATCQVALEGRVMKGFECSGQVSLNGQALGCDVPNGWSLIDDHTLQLNGAACDSFLTNQSALEAVFPCNVLVPQ